MPIPQHTSLAALPPMLLGAINAYNMPISRTANYNIEYAQFVAAKAARIANENLAAWVHGGGAAIAIHELLTAFRMNAQRSALVPQVTLNAALNGLNVLTLNWIATLALPLAHAASEINNPATNMSLSDELQVLFNSLAAPGAVTQSGGFVAASKTLHCLFPNLVPMIDGSHSGLSYFHIRRDTYMPPLGLASWGHWLGTPLPGVPNPSPRGAGRVNWDSVRFIAAIGINQHIYELWQADNGRPGLATFLALDPGTSGIPRVIDKLLW